MNPYHHVYILSDAQGTPIYVGMSKDVPQRLTQHRAAAPWYPEVASERTEGPFSRAEAVTRERELIGQLQPRYNTYHRNGTPSRDHSLDAGVTKSFCLSRYVAEALVARAKVSEWGSQSSVVEEALIAYLGLAKPLAA